MTKDALPLFAKKNVILAQDLLTYEAKDIVKAFGVTLEIAEKLVAEAAGIVGPR
jgi:hypothetical protein